MTATHNHTAGQVWVLPTQPDHADGIERLQAAVYDANPHEWDDMITAAKARQHVKQFPAGQYVALDAATNQVIGMTVSMRINFDPAQPFLESWYATTSNGWLTNHAPGGAWMYGVESCVHPHYQGRGVGSKLMDARFEVLKQLNLRGMVAGSAINDYHRASHLSPDAYVRDVAAGKLFDNNLTKQLRKGFRVHNVIPNYLEDSDEGNLGYGVAIVWDNPDYEAGRGVPQSLKQPRYEFALRPRRT